MRSGMSVSPLARLRPKLRMSQNRSDTVGELTELAGDEHPKDDRLAFGALLWPEAGLTHPMPERTARDGAPAGTRSDFANGIRPFSLHSAEARLVRGCFAGFRLKTQFRNHPLTTSGFSESFETASMGCATYAVYN
jgi:hypothetical protein